MGLDITVYSPMKEYKDEYSEFVINDELDRFRRYIGEEFIIDKVNQYYDFEAIGITEDRYDWAATGYEGPDYKSVWEFQDKESPFYKLLMKIEGTDDGIDSSRLTEDIRKELISMGILDYIREEDLVTHPNDNIAGMDNNGNPYYSHIHWFLNEKCKVIINEPDIPVIDKDDKVVYGKEIGYQRKGLNGLFYDEYKDEDYYVFTSERLQYIYDHYVEDDMKEYFKVHVLDKHVDGKTFVTFGW